MADNTNEESFAYKMWVSWLIVCAMFVVWFAISGLIEWLSPNGL